MKPNKRYRVGQFLYFLKTKLPKLYFFATKPPLNKVIYESLINYYLQNKNSIVKKVWFKQKKVEEVTPQVVKE